jgi:hypothetical protein
MTNIHHLNEKQQRIINKIICDSRARYIEIPFDPATCPMVKVLQGDGQQIGTVELHIVMSRSFTK